MSSFAFSTNSLTEEEAQLIADAYFRGDKDPVRMARLLEVEQFDLNLLMHPLVRRFIVENQVALNRHYSLEEHLTKLKQIRDGAMDDENWKVALSAEVAVGKAAGLYEPRLPDDGKGDNVDPAKLTTEELRQRLAKAIGASIPREETSAIENCLLEDHSSESDEVGEL